MGWGRKKPKTPQQLEKEMLRIQRSTHTLFAFMAPVHDQLRMKSRPYYRWHLFAFADAVHWAVLCMFILLLTFAFYGTILLNPQTAYAASYTWTGLGASDNWSDVNNWVVGGIVPASPPTNGDNITIDTPSGGGFTTSTQNLTGKTFGTISINNITVTISTSTGMSSITIGSGTLNINASISPSSQSFTVNGGIVNVGSVALGANAVPIVNGGEYHAGSSTLTGTYYYDLKLNGGTYYADTSNYHILGGLYMYNSSVFYGGSATYNIDGYSLGITLDSSFTGTFDGESASFQVNGYVQNAGAFIAPSSLTITIGQTFNHAAGTFDHNNGAVTCDGCTTIQGDTTFYNLTLTRPASDSWNSARNTTFPAGTDIVVDNDLVASNNSTAGDLVIKASSTAVPLPTITVNGTVSFPSTASAKQVIFGDATYQINATLNGDLEIVDATAAEKATVTFGGSAANQYITHTAGSINGGTWTVNKSSGSVNLNSNLSLSGIPLTITAGTFNLATNTLTSTSSLTLNGGTFDGNTGTATIAAFTQTNGEFIVPSGGATFTSTFNRSGGTFTNNSANVTFLANSSYNITSANATFYDLSIGRTDGSSSIYTLSLKDAFTVANTFTAQSNTPGTININGSGVAAAPIITANTVSFPSTAGACVINFGSTTASSNFTLNVTGDYTMADSNVVSNAITNFTAKSADQTVTRSAGTIQTGTWSVDKYDSGSSTDYTLYAGNLSINTAFTVTSGIVDISAGAFTATAFTQNGGTFNSGASAMNITTFTQGGGTFNATTGNLAINSTINRTSGTFNHNNGTINITLASTYTLNITSASAAYNNINITRTDNNSSTFNVAFKDACTIDGTLTMKNEGDTSAGPMNIIGSGVANNPTITVNNVSLPSTAQNKNLALGSSTASNNFTITVTGNFTQADSNITTYTNMTFNNKTADQTATSTAGTVQTGTWTIDKHNADGTDYTLNAADLSISSPVTLASGILDIGSGSFASGSFTQSSGTFNGTSGTAAFTAFSQSNGIFNAPSGNLTISGTINRTGGTFNHNSGTLILTTVTSTSNFNFNVTTAGATFNNLTLNRTDNNGSVLTVSLKDAFTIAGTLTIKNEGDTNATNININGSGVAGTPIITANNVSIPSTTQNKLFNIGSTTTPSNNFTLNITGNFSQDDSNANTYVITSFTNKTADQAATKSAGVIATGAWSADKHNTDTGIDYTLDVADLAISSNFTLTSGILSIGSGTFSVNDFTQNGGTFDGGSGSATFNAFTQSNGTFNAPSNSLATAYTFNRTGGTFNHNNGTVSILAHASYNVTTGNATFYNLTIGKTSSASSSGYTITLCDNFTVANTLTVRDDTNYAFFINGSNTPTITTKNLDFPLTSSYSGGVIVGNSVAAWSFSLTVGGDLSMGDGGITFWPDITFNNNALVSHITGTVNYQKTFTCTTASKQLVFEASKTQTITGTFTINGGSAGTRVSLRSSVDGTQWNITANGTRSVQYADVKDSNNTNAGNKILATYSVDSTNNTNWTFPTPQVVTGTVNTITSASAVGYGSVSADQGETVTEWGIEYSLIADDPSPTRVIGTGNNTSFSAVLTDLFASQQYYYRAYASNAERSGYGNWSNFTTTQTSVTITISQSTIEEAGGVSIVTATPDNLSGATITVDLEFTGTATKDTDYSTTGTTITIAAMADSGNVTVAGIDDTAPDNNETIIITISSATNATVGDPNSATITIADDDGDMTSSSFRMKAYVMSNGGNKSTSDNFILEDTLGETATGDSGSDSFALNAGFWAGALDYSIAISTDPAEIVMTAILGTGQSTITSPTSNKATITVNTDSVHGYELYWHANSANMLNEYDDYIGPFTPDPAGTPDDWYVDPNDAEWGGHLGSESTTRDGALWGGSGYETGKWINVDTSDYCIAARHDRPAAGGDQEVIYLGAEVGSNHLQPSGTYRASVTITALTID